MKKMIALTIMMTGLLHAGDDAVADALCCAASAHASSGQIERARTVYFQALALDDRCGEAYFGLGSLMEGRDHYAAGCYYKRAAVCLKNEVKASIAVSRMRNFDPSAGKLMALIDEYVRGVDSIVSSRTDSLTRDEAVKRLNALKIDELLPRARLPQFMLGHKIDLLPLIDVSKDALDKAAWQQAPDMTLISPDTGKHKLQIMYSAPEEYEYRVEFRRLDQNANGVVGIVVPTKLGSWQLLYHQNWRANMPGPSVEKNHMPQIIPGEKTVLSLKVKDDNIDGYINDVIFASTKAQPLDHNPMYDWYFKDKRAFGIGVQNCKAEFTSIKLIETSGHGNRLR